ncbi:hypothetical protein EHF33_09540 [Deinococcus psychrotolerans]|uniref:Uncharacterized protein n=1 Tax=Deinococcus psychrotolerans TaxID=2489213 RepID=A0A3G8YDA0_9DEIO|nr:hypothetical protein [Deinococcus psychrotolerans]AZI42955.1 hypothetical protein EHF33_09540 [Deinococcus psychrotolerans]
MKILLWLLAAVLGALALGAFASLNPAAPTWMRALSALEGVLLSHLLTAYPRGILEALGAALVVFLAALPTAANSTAKVASKPA